MQTNVLIKEECILKNKNKSCQYKKLSVFYNSCLKTFGSHLVYMMYNIILIHCLALNIVVCLPMCFDITVCDCQYTSLTVAQLSIQTHMWTENRIKCKAVGQNNTVHHNNHKVSVAESKFVCFNLIATTV